MVSHSFLCLRKGSNQNIQIAVTFYSDEIFQFCWWIWNAGGISFRMICILHFCLIDVFRTHIHSLYIWLLHDPLPKMPTKISYAVKTHKELNKIDGCQKSLSSEEILLPEWKWKKTLVFPTNRNEHKSKIVDLCSSLTSKMKTTYIFTSETGLDHLQIRKNLACQLTYISLQIWKNMIFFLKSYKCRENKSTSLFKTFILVYCKKTSQGTTHVIYWKRNDFVNELRFFFWFWLF